MSVHRGKFAPFSAPANSYIVKVSPILPYVDTEGAEVHFRLVADIVYMSREAYEELKARALKAKEPS